MSNLVHSKDISTADVGLASELRCPRCGASNLHHHGVTAFDRSEDAATVTKTVVEGATVSMSVDNGAGNPSSRRDGMAIRFSCEQCGDDLIELTLAQHKGTTEIGWRFEPKS